MTRFLLSLILVLAVTPAFAQEQKPLIPRSGGARSNEQRSGGPKAGGKKKGPEPGSKAGDNMLRRLAEFERLDRMSDEDRQRALDRLPAPRRQRIEDGLARYRAMDPENRERLLRFERMSPEQKDSIRENFRRMQELPPGRRVSVRRELQRLRGMDPALRDGAMQTDAFRRRFDDGEQQLIRESIANLPPG